MGTVLDTVTYTYGDSDWGDLLTGYDGKTITYDTIGNPLSDGTWTYTWEHGRELASMSNGSTTWNMTYNADGLRTKRTNGSTTYSYIYNGSSLSQMTVGSNTLRFAYDASGTPMSVTYNGTNYYYVTNIQGDITAILNTSGTAVVQYTYDAWGNILTTTGSMASTLGETNPLRYRGYVYDRETGLYYLQSRYYNPELGRFINADSYASTGEGILGNNMFSYCGNSPVTYVDPSGLKREFWSQLFEDSDPGYIHRAVQLHILVTHNLEAYTYKSEYVLPGVGRADIVCPGTNEMWEIKHGGSNSVGWNRGIGLARERLDRYKSKGVGLVYGAANKFNGSFVIGVGSTRYLVSYSTPEKGIILYTVDRMQGERKPDYVYVPYTLYEEQKEAMGLLVAGMAFGVVFGMANGNNEQACLQEVYGY